MVAARLRVAGWLAAGLLCCGLGTVSRAESPEEIFNRGNTAYEQNRYEEAADAYRSLLRYRVEDPRLEYNLANAEFRLGRLGHAILHYERARQLDPTDPDIRDNLALAREMTYDRVAPPAQLLPLRWIATAQERLGPDRQAWMLLGLVWAIAALVAWRVGRPGAFGAAAGWALTVLVLAAGLCALSWSMTFHRLDGAQRAVILDDVVEVLAGPGENNAVLATLHEGLTVEVRAERPDWVQISVPGGLSGWIARAALEVV